MHARRLLGALRVDTVSSKLLHRHASSGATVRLEAGRQLVETIGRGKDSTSTTVTGKPRPVRSAEPVSRTAKPQSPPVQTNLFTLLDKGPSLSISDLSSAAGCEYQLVYAHLSGVQWNLDNGKTPLVLNPPDTFTSSTGKELRIDKANYQQYIAGRASDWRAQAAGNPTLGRTVAVANPGDRSAAAIDQHARALWTTALMLLKLHAEGHIRNVLVWGMVDGVLIRGRIDLLRRRIAPDLTEIDGQWVQDRDLDDTEAYVLTKTKIVRQMWPKRLAWRSPAAQQARLQHHFFNQIVLRHYDWNEHLRLHGVDAETPLSVLTSRMLRHLVGDSRSETPPLPATFGDLVEGVQAAYSRIGVLYPMITLNFRQAGQDATSKESLLGRLMLTELPKDSTLADWAQDVVGLWRGERPPRGPPPWRSDMCTGCPFRPDCEGPVVAQPGRIPWRQRLREEVLARETARQSRTVPK